MALLELKNVVASYGNINALKGISLSVPEGKIVTLIGANGAGKSTTMRTIMGLMKPKEGDVLFKGKSIVGKNLRDVVLPANPSQANDCCPQLSHKMPLPFPESVPPLLS